MKRAIDVIWEFISDTAWDFEAVWNYRSNVLIWCAIAGFILYWL